MTDQTPADPIEPTPEGPEPSEELTPEASIEPTLPEAAEAAEVAATGEIVLEAQAEAQAEAEAEAEITPEAAEAGPADVAAATGDVVPEAEADVPEDAPDGAVAEEAPVAEEGHVADEAAVAEGAAADAVPEELAAAVAVDSAAADAPVAVAPVRRSRLRRGIRFAGAFTLAFLIAALIGTSIGAAAMYAYSSAYQGKVPAGVNVGGVDVSGLDQVAAESRIQAAFSAMTQGSIVLKTPTVDRMIPYVDFGRSVDAPAAITSAMAIARDGDVVHQALASARTAIDGVSIAPTVTLDAALLETAIDRIVRDYERAPRDAVVTSTKDGVVITPGQAGTAVDRATILKSVLEQVGRVDAPTSIVVPLTPEPVQPALTTTEAETAKRNADAMATPVLITHGSEKWTIKAPTVRSWVVLEQTPDGEVTYGVDRAKVAASVEKLRTSVDVKAVNATYLTSKGGKVIGVKASKDGRTMDTEATTDLVAAAVLARAAGTPAAPIAAKISGVAPKLTTAEAEKTAPQLKMISGHTTWFPYGERNFFGNNIWIPGKLINGTVVAPGETFDFWKVVGIPSSSRGFGAGGAIINGKTEPTGALAGGICSCSTTLFNAAAKAGLKLGKRRMHYYYIDRYPMGLDATVWISSSGSRQTMSFTNDTKYPILIVNRNWRVGSKGYVRFEMWSVPNGRKVRFTSPIIRNVRQATTNVFYTSALPHGAVRQEESQHDGMDVTRTRIVTDAKGKVIHKDVISSHYARVDGIILKGK